MPYPDVKSLNFRDLLCKSKKYIPGGLQVFFLPVWLPPSSHELSSPGQLQRPLSSSPAPPAHISIPGYTDR